MEEEEQEQEHTKDRGIKNILSITFMIPVSTLPSRWWMDDTLQHVTFHENERNKQPLQLYDRLPIGRCASHETVATSALISPTSFWDFYSSFFLKMNKKESLKKYLQREAGGEMGL